MESGVFTKINLEHNEAFVNSYLWNSVEYQVKENITQKLASYCGIVRENDLNYIYIKDSRSGKDLAKYSDWGFTVY